MPPSHWPIVPSTSGWPAWPIITISRPCSRIFATSTCTLVTSGQVASNTLRPRASASRAPPATRRARENTTVRAGGHLVELLDEHRALGAQVVDHELVVHDLVAHVDRRAELRERRSTIAMARSTPAQKPRGLASRTSIAVSLMARAARRVAARCAEAVEDQQRRADGDRAVGDVERRPTPAARSGTAGNRRRARSRGGRRGCRARRRGSARAPAQNSALPPRRSSHDDARPQATTAIAVKNQRCQPSAPARKLNAAPVLYVEHQAEERRDRAAPRPGGTREHRAPWSRWSSDDHDQRRRHSQRASASTLRAPCASCVMRTRAARRRRRGWPRSARRCAGCAASAPTSAR